MLPTIDKMCFTKDFPKLKICVTGAGGFIASHLAKRLKDEGHFVRGVDWKENEHMTEDMFCDEFMCASRGPTWRPAPFALGSRRWIATPLTHPEVS